jgi:methylenetetrahydrofolate dehydrogenase (NADP+)/methenyltetrahydrofolate cyclohydrolase
MGQWLEGKPVAEKIREGVKAEVAKFKETTGKVPGLTGVLVGDNPASQSYLRMKEKACQSLGLFGQLQYLPADIPRLDLKARIEALNADERVDGILVQLPLPKGHDTQEVISWIDPGKDVDGIHPISLGLLLQNQPCLSACTPRGCLELIRSTGTAIEGKDVVVIGRSLIVGKPLSVMITNENGTVTVCHSKTKDLPGVCSRADILIAAMGKPGFVGPEFVKEGAVVIDVGVNRIGTTPEGKARLCGDVDFDTVSQKASLITPVPGGVGPMTITMLLMNTLKAAERSAKAI